MALILLPGIGRDNGIGGSVNRNKRTEMAIRTKPNLCPAAIAEFRFQDGEAVGSQDQLHPGETSGAVCFDRRSQN